MVESVGLCLQRFPMNSLAYCFMSMGDSQVFPGQTSAKRPISKDSVLAKLKERRAALKLRLLNHANS